MRRYLWWAVVAFATTLLVVVPAVSPRYVVSLFTLTVITALLAISVNMLAGEVGLLSMGHAGIAGAAGYAIAWGARQHLDLAPQLGLALAVTLLVSAVYGVTAMRTDGIVFLMITLALGIVVFGLALKWSRVTGGQSGLTGIRRPAAFADPQVFYYLCLILTAVVLLGLTVLRRSPFGLVLRGVRDSERRMTSLGYSTPATKFVAMMISGLVAGLAGVLGVWNAQFISPAVAAFDKSAMAVIIVILGGIGFPFGTILGAGLVVGIQHWLSSYVERWPTLLGLLFVATVIFMPRGIAGAIQGAAAGRVAVAPWSTWLSRIGIRRSGTTAPEVEIPHQTSSPEVATRKGTE
jgi:branched-chain amino acid transport system permease protein